MQAYAYHKEGAMRDRKEPTGRARGGVSRAKALTKVERHSIAKRAAESRWKELPKAIASGFLKVANVELECYVLEDGTRILSQAGFLISLGRHRKAWVRSKEGVPAILQSKALKPFITEETLKRSTPLTFLTPYGTRANGYRAELLPEVAELYLKARDAKKLAPNQKHVAIQADILIRAFANVGIIALVDEATGYQDWRARTALADILEEFIAKELQPWVRTFPGDYYKHIFRLRGLDYPEDNIRKPQYFGILTNDIIYKRLAPGVLDELRRVTPRNQNGRPTAKYFQSLTSNKGYPALRELLGSVVTVMMFSDSWNDFMDKLNKRHPRYNSQLPLPMEYDAETDTGRGI